MTSERRRYARRDATLAVTLTTPTGRYEGFTENVSYTGLLVQGLGEIPASGLECEVEVDLLTGILKAQGLVTRVTPKENRYAVDLTHLIQNGQLLLAFVLG